MQDSSRIYDLLWPHTDPITLLEITYVEKNVFFIQAFNVPNNYLTQSDASTIIKLYIHTTFQSKCASKGTRKMYFPDLGYLKSSLKTLNTVLTLYIFLRMCVGFCGSSKILHHTECSVHVHDSN